jgi:alpha-galactosidase
LIVDGLIHLRAAGVSLVVDARGPRLPRILHWGQDLGALCASELGELALAAVPPVASNTMDAAVAVGVLPEHATGWAGLPGLRGHRDGRAWSPLFEVHGVVAAEGGNDVVVDAADAAAGLSLRLEIELTPSGLVRMRAAVRNTGETPYTLDGLVLCLPVPAVADELLDFTGRHLRERSPQRRPFDVGTRLRDSRRGRTGHDATLLMIAGTARFGFGHGEVWGVHVAWSGNHRTFAERMPDGEAVLGGGELLLPGEVRLPPGGEYAGPWLYAGYGAAGLDSMSARFHKHLRSRRGHPTRPRPVVLNTWEAVYFDQDLDRLRALAQAAAEVGVERFVLDDGWFRHRRNDRAGLGDWYVDEQRWPQGLHPLVDRVLELGMEFGLWVEPEMVNLDSDVARAHPEWVLATGGRIPPPSRHQQVLDLSHAGAYDYLLERLDALLREYRISYLKWDHNRDLVDAGHSPEGEAAVRAQTLAIYALLDELRSRHPDVEIESCSSGGGRVDLAILERTDRIWTSDCNDALERQAIQRWTGLLLPPELLGAHVGPDVSHTTERRHTMAFRAGTALFGHFGIECDISRLDADQRTELARWVEAYRELRGMLHSGRVVRSDHPDPAVWVHGVVAADGSQALFAVVAVATPVAAPPGRVRLPGLDAEATYAVRPLPPGDAPGTVNPVPAPWLASGLTLSGAVLGRVGVQVPNLQPEQLLLLRLERHPPAG